MAGIISKETTLQNILQCISDREAFENLSEYILPDLKDLNNAEIVVDILSENILNKKNEPIKRILALSLHQKCMTKKSHQYVNKFVSNKKFRLWDKIKKWALISDKDKLLKIFKNQSSLEESKEFHDIILYCVAEWSQIYGLNTKKENTLFRNFYEECIDSGIKFPSTMPASSIAESKLLVNSSKLSVDSSTLKIKDSPKINPSSQNNANEIEREFIRGLEDLEKLKIKLAEFLQNQDTKLNNFSALADNMKNLNHTLFSNNLKLGLLLSIPNKDKIKSNAIEAHEFCDKFIESLELVKNGSKTMATLRNEYQNLYASQTKMHNSTLKSSINAHDLHSKSNENPIIYESKVYEKKPDVKRNPSKPNEESSPDFSINKKKLKDSKTSQIDNDSRLLEGYSTAKLVSSKIDTDKKKSLNASDLSNREARAAHRAELMKSLFDTTSSKVQPTAHRISPSSNKNSLSPPTGKIILNKPEITQDEELRKKESPSLSKYSSILSDKNKVTSPKLTDKHSQINPSFDQTSTQSKIQKINNGLDVKEIKERLHSNESPRLNQPKFFVEDFRSNKSVIPGQIKSEIISSAKPTYSLPNSTSNILTDKKTSHAFGKNPPYTLSYETDQKNVNEWNQKLEILEKENKLLLKKNDDLLEKLIFQETENEKLREKIDQKTKIVVETNTDKEKYTIESRLNLLILENEKLKRKIQKKKEKNMAFSNECSGLFKQRDINKSRIEELLVNNERLSRELNQLQKDYKAIEEQFEIYKNTSEVRNADLLKACKKMKSENEDFLEEIGNNRKKLADSEVKINRLHEENQNLSNELNLIKPDYLSLQENYVKIKKDYELLVSDNHAAKEAYNHGINKFKSEINKLTCSIKEINQENKDLRNDIIHFQKLAETSKKNEYHVSNNCGEITGDNEKLKLTINKLNHELNLVENERNELEKIKSKQGGELTLLNDKYNELKLQFEELIKENESLRAKAYSRNHYTVDFAEIEKEIEEKKIEVQGMKKKAIDPISINNDYQESNLGKENLVNYQNKPDFIEKKKIYIKDSEISAHRKIIDENDPFSIKNFSIQKNQIEKKLDDQIQAKAPEIQYKQPYHEKNDIQQSVSKHNQREVASTTPKRMRMSDYFTNLPANIENVFNDQAELAQSFQKAPSKNKGISALEFLSQKSNENLKAQVIIEDTLQEKNLLEEKQFNQKTPYNKTLIQSIEKTVVNKEKFVELEGAFESGTSKKIFDPEEGSKFNPSTHTQNHKKSFSYSPSSSPKDANMVTISNNPQKMIGETSQMSIKLINNKYFAHKVLEYCPALFSSLKFISETQAIRFKICCLMDRGILLEDKDLSLSISSTTSKDNLSKDKTSVKMMLIYQNKGSNPLKKFSIDFQGDKSMNVLMKSDQPPQNLKPNEDFTQNTLITYDKIPYTTVGMNISFNARSLLVSLPVLITKFMIIKNPKSLKNNQIFKEKWIEMKNKGSIFSTDLFMTNNALLKGAYELKSFIPQLIELNPEEDYDHLSGKCDLKYGLFTEIGHGPDNEFLMKINFTPSQKVLVRLGFLHKNTTLSANILQAMQYILMS